MQVSQHHKVLAHFEAVDLKLFKVARLMNFDDWYESQYSPTDYFERLCRSIVGQQLAGAAARVIYGRFVNTVGSRFSPSDILQTSHEDLRSVGLSNAKALSIRDLAEKTSAGLLLFDSFPEMSNEAISKALVQIRGIGQWTAEMFMMFTLQREDIFSYGDLGLKKGIQKLYELDDYPTKEEAESISETWSPYRTYACMVLWHVVDTDVAVNS